MPAAPQSSSESNPEPEAVPLFMPDDFDTTRTDEHGCVYYELTNDRKREALALHSRATSASAANELYGGDREAHLAALETPLPTFTDTEIGIIRRALARRSYKDPAASDLLIRMRELPAGTKPALSAVAHGPRVLAGASIVLGFFMQPAKR